MELYHSRGDRRSPCASLSTAYKIAVRALGLPDRLHHRSRVGAAGIASTALSSCCSSTNTLLAAGMAQVFSWRDGSIPAYKLSRCAEISVYGQLSPPQDRGDAHGHAIKALPGVLAIVWYLLTPTFSNWARFPARLVRLHVRFQIDVHRTESWGRGGQPAG